MLMMLEIFSKHLTIILNLQISLDTQMQKIYIAITNYLSKMENPDIFKSERKTIQFMALPL